MAGVGSSSEWEDWFHITSPRANRDQLYQAPGGKLLEERTGAANRVLQDGSGIAVGDYDNDGLPDIYFCSLNGRNALYKNLGGWKFKDVTTESGIVCTNQFCRGAVFADLNGDGSLDLLVATTGNGVLCFLNDGHGKFSDVTQAAGTASKYGSVTMALADVDGNGTLDLYVANNRTDDIRDRGQVDVQMVNGKLAVPPQFKDRLVIVDGKLLEYRAWLQVEGVGSSSEWEDWFHITSPRANRDQLYQSPGGKNRGGEQSSTRWFWYCRGRLR